MLESVCLGREISKSEFKELEPSLRLEMFEAQQLARKHNIPVYIILSGMNGSGRGRVANMISTYMDAKGVKSHTFWRETYEDIARPYAWRYWRKMPRNGEIATLYSAWYGNPIRSFAVGDITQEKFENLMHQWVQFERTIVANGGIIIKLWLHIDKKTHKEQHKKRLKNHEERHFSPIDDKLADKYDEIVAAASLAIKITDKEESPWTLIDAKNSKFRDVTVAKTIVAEIKKMVEIKQHLKAYSYDDKSKSTNNTISTINAIDLTKTISDDDYSTQQKELRKQINELTYQAYKRGISSTLVFEGCDAAGKGGVIRRISNSVDARITQVIPVSSPTDIELSHHYLWRFWSYIPLAGFITIYDRSWYGRVLVERVEKLAKPNEWGRAYSEINNFEDQLTENGNILLKFWLHVSPDEQLRRFKEREEVEFKNYKITPDDWRNRDKQDDYNLAADEMFLRTSTDNAPWHVIPSENKKYARIEVMKIYKKTLENAIMQHDKVSIANLDK